MARTIYLRVGSRDSITLPELVTALANFLHLLQDIDAGVANTKSGNLLWQVTVLQKNSPALIGVTPRPRPRAVDTSEIVETRVITGTSALSIPGNRPDFLADSSFERIQKIARQAARLGPSSIYVEANGKPAKEAAITEQIYRNVKELTGASYEAFGTINGKLEAISVHKSNEFRIWDKETGKPVRCRFDGKLEGHVKELLRREVSVAGLITSNSFGSPISVVVEGLSEYCSTDLPTIEQMSGLISDYTGGRTLKEYFEDLDDE